MKTLEKVSLFWDVDRSKLDSEAHADFIIKRVLAQGTIEDVRWAETQYGKTRLAEVSKRVRGLDEKSRNFWATHFAHAS